MLRPALAVIAGFLAWTLLWIVAGALVVTIAEIDIDAGRIDATIPLIVLLAASVVCSIAAGSTTTLVNRRTTGKPLWILAALLLVVGLAVELSSWSMYPAWYHLIFLAMLIPATYLGGCFAERNPAAA